MSGPTLDDLLARWHVWCGYGIVGRGYGRKALVVGDFRISRQYDDTNGALDDELEQRTCRAVDGCVDRLPNQLWRIALRFEAKHLARGLAHLELRMVQDMPRMPIDTRERQKITLDARAALAERLIGAGVLYPPLTRRRNSSEISSGP